jgi:hypothetical protein
MRTRIATLFVAAVACIGLAASPAGAAPAVLRATLTGSAVPTGGDPDGSGQAYVVVDEAANRICVVLFAQNISESIGAHIHKGRAGEIGPHVVGLNTPVGTGGGELSVTCQAGTGTVLHDIVADPADYYVNVHTTDYPLGAVRGQLVPVTSPGPPA